MLLVVTIAFFALLVLGCQIPLATAVAAVPFFLFTDRVDGMIIAQKIFTSNDSFSLLAIPFFMLAGSIMEATDITKGIVNFANSLVGHIRGGMAHTASLAGVIMAGVSGSANADASALGSLLLPTLKEAGYEDGYAVACIASAAGLGPIIPPSIMMVIYASITGYSTGKLFLGGILPGLCLAFGYMVINYCYARHANIPRAPFGGFRHVWDEFKSAVWALLMPVIIVGGILSGAFTATEAGVAAVLYGIVYGFITKRLTIKKLWTCFKDAVISTSSPMFIILTAGVLSYTINVLGVSAVIEQFCVTNLSNKWAFYGFVILILFIAGCLIDGNATMLMLVPVFLPIASMLGLNELQFAVIFITLLCMGGITPPVGMYLFIVCGVDGTPLERCLKWVIPFVIMNLIVVALMILFEPMTTFFPAFLQ